MLSKGGLHSDANRLRRVEGLLNELLMNPSIDNARRGPLQIANADQLPRFIRGSGRNTRVQWQEISFTGGAVYVDGANQKWMAVQMVTTAGASDTNLMDARTVLNLLPEMRCAFAHSGTPVSNIVRVGLVDNPLGNLIEPTGAFFRSTDSGTWRAVVRNGASETATDTGITAVGTPHEFRIKVVSPTRVEFFIDDNREHAESGSNIPPGTTLLRANVELYARAGATGASLTGLVSDYMTLSRLTRG